MRQDANSDGGNDMMKFISYSNHDPKLAMEISKKSQGSSSPQNNYNAGSLLAPGQNMLQLNHGPGSGNLPNVSMLVDKNKDDSKMSDN